MLEIKIMKKLKLIMVSIAKKNTKKNPHKKPTKNPPKTNELKNTNKSIKQTNTHTQKTTKYKEQSIENKLKFLKIQWKCLMIWCLIAWLINI